MIQVVLDDTFLKAQLFPFTLTRSAADIRIGILTIREKWQKMLGRKVTVNTDDYINPPAKGDAAIPVVFPANFIPDRQFVTRLLDESVSRESLLQDATRQLLERPWHIFEYNDAAIREDFALVTSGRKSAPVPAQVKTSGSGNIFIEEGAVLEHCTINAKDGPVYIGANTLIMDGACLRGPLALCEGAVVKMGASIYGATTIGPHCIVGGEVKNTVLFGYSNKAHHGYLGDSVIGEWCNLGAGTTNSNIKNNAAPVKVWDAADSTYTVAGLKCGLLMGDYSRAAINTSFNTGTVTGVCANIFGEGLTPKLIPSFSWGSAGAKSYRFEKAIEDIANWKRLKNQIVSEREIQLLQHIFDQS